MKASEIKRGAVLREEGHTYIVREVHVQTPSSRGSNTLIKVLGRDVVTKQKFDRSYKSDEVVYPVEFEKRDVQFLFRESDSSTFMDLETYEQYTIDNESISEELLYLTDGLAGIVALVADGAVLGISLPATVVLEIVDTAPAMKAASASARTKSATCTTGLVVQVPEYLSVGEKIKIHTQSGSFTGRA